MALRALQNRAQFTDTMTAEQLEKLTRPFIAAHSAERFPKLSPKELEALREALQKARVASPATPSSDGMEYE